MKPTNLTKQQIQEALRLATARQLASALGRKKVPICGHKEPEPDTCKLCKERLRLREYRARIHEE